MEPVPSHTALYDRLRRGCRTLRRWAVVDGVCRGLSVAGILLVSFTLVETAWRLSCAGRTVLGGAALFGVTVHLLHRGWAFHRRYGGLAGLERLALDWGQSTQDDRLANALAVHRVDGDTALTRRALDQAWSADREAALTSWVRSQRPVRSALTWAAVTILSFLLFVLPGAGLPQAAWRLAHPGVATPPATVLSIQTDRPWVVLGDTLAVAVRVQGRPVTEVRLQGRAPAASPTALTLHPPFETRWAVQHTGLELRAVAGRFRSPWTAVTVVRRPGVRSLNVTVHPPAYTGRRPQNLPANQGHVDALPGSWITVAVAADKPLDRAGLALASGRRLDLTVQYDQALGRFQLRAEDDYRVELRDSLGLENVQPIAYRLRLLDDLPPVARVRFPAMPVDLDESMTLPLRLMAQDDYGLSRLRLGYGLIQPGRSDSAEVRFIPLTADSTDSRTAWLSFDWPVDTLGLLPGDAVAYFFEAWDNDGFHGPKAGRSPVLTARFPSVDEIFADLAQQRDALADSVSALREENREIGQALQSLTDQLRTGQEPTWEQRQAVESALKRRETVAEKTQALRGQIQQTVESLDAQQMADLEILDKYMQIQESLRDLDSPQLRQAMERLRQAMSQSNLSQMDAALEPMALDQEALSEALDQALNLLQRAALEQRLEGLARQVEELAVNQERLNRTEDSQEAQRQAQAQKAGVQAAEREMADLAQAMQAVEHAPAQPVQQALERQQARRVPEKLEAQSKSLKSGRADAAQEVGQEALAALSEWGQDLESLQQGMRGSQNRRLGQALARQQQRLLELSQAQEALAASTQSGQTPGAQAAPRQQALSGHLTQTVDSLRALAKEGFFMPPPLSQALSQARSAMDRFVSQMGQSGRPVPSNLGEALAQLNRGLIVMEGLSGGSASGSGGEGSAAQQLMAGLEQMTQQQQALQRQTLDLLNQGGLSPAQQAAARRLGGEQRALGDRLDKLLQELGGQADLEGRLESLDQEAEAAAQDLESGAPDRETVQRQQRILSRLLEAQHASREQDLSRRRQARAGMDVSRRSPGALGAVRPAPSWREQLLNLDRQGYSADDQALIRRYFEALIQAQTSTGGRR